VQGLENDRPAIYEAALRLSRTGDTDAQSLYLISLAGRFADPTTGAARSGTDAESLPPLADDELEHMLACYRSLRKRNPAQALVYGGLTNVLLELKRAGRKDAEEELFREAVASANTPYEVYLMLSQAGQRGETATVMDLFQRLQTLERQQTGMQQSSYVSSAGSSLARALSTLAEESTRDQIPQL
jgi:hypothetical protein